MLNSDSFTSHAHGTAIAVGPPQGKSTTAQIIGYTNKSGKRLAGSLSKKNKKNKKTYRTTNKAQRDIASSRPVWISAARLDVRWAASRLLLVQIGS